MGSDLEKDLERGIDMENGTTCTESTYHSDIEEADLTTLEEGAMGTPDPDHEEVKQTDTGHLDDLARQHVSPQVPSWLERTRPNLSADHRIYQCRPSGDSRRARDRTDKHPI